MDIKCRKIDCKFNNNFVCCAKSIEIIDKTFCATYEKGNNKNLKNDLKHMFDRTIRFNNNKQNRCIKLKCNAHCFFNKNLECFSNGITILDNETSAVCGNFLKKTNVIHRLEMNDNQKFQRTIMNDETKKKSIQKIK